MGVSSFWKRGKQCIDGEQWPRDLNSERWELGIFLTLEFSVIELYVETIKYGIDLALTVREKEKQHTKKGKIVTWQDTTGRNLNPGKWWEMFLECAES